MLGYVIFTSHSTVQTSEKKMLLVILLQIELQTIQDYIYVVALRVQVIP